jgi:hypothetical protein
MGKSFDEDMLKSPLTVGRPRNEPGPETNNNPVAEAADPLGFLPSNSRRAGRKSGL